jgi:toxin HigB-1
MWYSTRNPTEMDDLDTIVTWLFSRKRRATYGAIAGLLNRTPRDLMRGRQRSKTDSWVVALTDWNEPRRRPDGTPCWPQAGWPTGYRYDELDRACYEQARDSLDNVIKDKVELRQWLDRRRLIASRIKHRGIKRLYERADDSQIDPDLVEKVKGFLTALDSAASVQAFNFPDNDLHQLESGDFKGFWAVKLTANWSIVFRFEGTEPFDIQLMDVRVEAEHLLAIMLSGMLSHSKIGQFNHCQKATVLAGVRARHLNTSSAEGVLEKNSEAFQNTRKCSALFLFKEHNDGRQYFLNPHRVKEIKTLVRRILGRRAAP